MYRWPDGRVYHVSLSDVTASRYMQQVNDVIRSCEKRLGWLQRGSRLTFGIVAVHKVSSILCMHTHYRNLTYLHSHTTYLLYMYSCMHTYTHTEACIRVATIRCVRRIDILPLMYHDTVIYIIVQYKMESKHCSVLLLREINDVFSLRSIMYHLGWPQCTIIWL